MSQICKRLTMFSQRLPQEPWVPENSLRTPFLHFYFRRDTRLHNEVDISKVLVGEKSMGCEAQIARLTRRRLFPELTRGVRSVSTGVENALSYGAPLLAHHYNQYFSMERKLHIKKIIIFRLKAPLLFCCRFVDNFALKYRRNASPIQDVSVAIKSWGHGCEQV